MGDFQTIEARLREARTVYIFEPVFATSGYEALTFGEQEGQLEWFYLGYGYEFGFGTDREAFKAWLDTIPHISVPKWGRTRPTQTFEKAYSPDGRFYVARMYGWVNEKVVIYTREGRPVAEAYKAGWTPDVLGWAGDSSGVYFQMWISGSAAGSLVPYKPIFKLSPLTTKDLLWEILKWITGFLVLLGGGWWLIKRNRSVLSPQIAN